MEKRNVGKHTVRRGRIIDPFGTCRQALRRQNVENKLMTVTASIGGMEQPGMLAGGRG